MASLSYLYKNRAKFSVTSVAFYKAWAKRLLTFNELMKRNYRRWKLLRKGADIHPTAEIGLVEVGGQKKKLTIGPMSFLGKVQIALHDAVVIGANVCINDGAILLTASHNTQDSLWRHVKGPIIIGDYAWIATNAIILPGVSIGKGAVVGAGAVVTRDVKDFEIVAGNPAKPISKKRIEELNYNPCEFLAANLAWIKG
ncbi:acyltransferase [Mucilaginibacter sp. RS28]|uniref:Acyltransferase n=1 Tax=Mucilaginibacter straminoryzae TaxID=2932774 RepID=A0A9X1X3I2_9SPHI|nr:DapH/DapD/GlmU-related protein [Mucilaginibacter straminoryzae]MCJ8210236.1 acyltransferase [Mucilaginibacter straminoryzae]